MYCKNCGFELKSEDRFCTNCGFDKYNNQANNNQPNDKANIWLIIVCVLFPIIGLILYFSLKDTEPKKAKSYGKSSLISFIISLILIIIMAVLAFLAFSYIVKEAGDSWTEIIDENYYEYDETYYDEDDINYFTYVIDNYAKLASGNFYKDIYTDNTITEKCYNIDDLEESIYYDGSIEIRLVDGKEKITIWLTDSEYYVEAIDYDTYTINDIKVGDKIESSCRVGDANNSL